MAKMRVISFENHDIATHTKDVNEFLETGEIIYEIKSSVVVLYTALETRFQKRIYTTQIYYYEENIPPLRIIDFK